MSQGHQHIGGPGTTQNQGNMLGDRPCVRQSRLYREHVGGNAMKELMGQSNLQWDTKQTQGAYAGGAAYDALADQPSNTMQARKSRAEQGACQPPQQQQQQQQEVRHARGRGGATKSSASYNILSHEASPHKKNLPSTTQPSPSITLAALDTRVPPAHEMLCLVPPSVNGLDDSATAARYESKMREEHLAVHQMFTARPELLKPVNELLRKFRTQHFPCEAGGESQYWRQVVSHFKRHPNEDFDDLDPFYVVDFGAIVRQMAKFRKHLPMVIPHYAVKCNPSECLVAMISALGGGFDCASSAEFSMVINSRYAEVDDIIFANPCKSRHDLRKAEAMGVRLVTFDNVQELHKIASYMPSAKAVLRLKTNDAAAVCQFSRKFGAGMDDVPELLSTAKELGVRVVGVSFHVGSGNNDPNAYVSSIMNARSVFDQGEELGFDMKLLDIGGGFPGTEPPVGANGKPECLSFEEIAACIRPVLAEHFSTARIIAEPGRYYAAASHTLAVNVHSKRVVKHANNVLEHQIYINDGLYHSFNSILFDHAHPQLQLLAPDVEARTHPTTIFGPTCDSLDCILKMQDFPALDVGEWLFAANMGAYTTAAGCPFNGFATRRMEYACSLPSSCFADLLDE